LKELTKSSVISVESLKRNVIVEKLELVAIKPENLLENDLYLCGSIYVENEQYLIDWNLLRYQEGFLVENYKFHYDPEKFDIIYKLPAKNL
jgi:hypothetical protein